jgi:hypothetical protein
MLKAYFNDLNKVLSKKSSAKGTKKTSVTFDISLLMEKFEGIIPSELRISQARPINTTGFSPEGADFIVHKNYCRDFGTLFNGYVPFELIQGAFFFIPELKKNTLADALNRVSSIKKINRFSDEEHNFSVPCFIVTTSVPEYSLLDIKNDVLNYYISKGIGSEEEFELMMIYNHGILIKDWHSDNRRYVGLETGEDTLMWFYVLMSEYVSIERDDEFDMRRYIKSDKVYNEF